jgi:hypothetical protein
VQRVRPERNPCPDLVQLASTLEDRDIEAGTTQGNAGSQASYTGANDNRFRQSSISSRQSERALHHLNDSAQVIMPSTHPTVDSRLRSTTDD